MHLAWAQGRKASIASDQLFDDQPLEGGKVHISLHIIEKRVYIELPQLIGLIFVVDTANRKFPRP
jgi:hypothetical protein